ncbi:MAG TPA: hypothetical protein DIC36_00790 [Gammaproteobacteria bacterium]|jgi:hypothetical protein|nr:hypothetical protein [Gammaproteobacteria bacterium]
MFRVLSWLGIFTGVPALTVWVSSLELDHFVLFFAFSILALAFGVFSYLLAVEPGKRWARPDAK